MGSEMCIRDRPRPMPSPAPLNPGAAQAGMPRPMPAPPMPVQNRPVPNMPQPNMAPQPMPNMQPQMIPQMQPGAMPMPQMQPGAAPMPQMAPPQQGQVGAPLIANTQFDVDPEGTKEGGERALPQISIHAFCDRQETAAVINETTRDWRMKRTNVKIYMGCLLYTSPSPRDGLLSRMPSSA